MVNHDVLTPGSLTSGPRFWPARYARTATLPLNTSVDVIADPAAFAGMEAAWNETVDRAGLHHPFLRHEWLRTWWECFGAGHRLHIIVVKSEGRILAIAPLMWESAAMYGVQIRRLRLLQNDHTPDADFIIADEPETSYRAIWQTLMTMPDRWDVLLLSEVPRSSPTLRALTVLAAAYGLPTGVWPSDDSPYLSTERTWESYEATLTPAFRQNLRNRWTRLTKFGSPELEVLEGREAVERGCADALRLEASGWKQQQGTSIESESETHRFYTELAPRAADAGWLRLLFLTVGGRRIATAYSGCFNNRLLFIKTGYDPEFAKCSPFKVLTHLAVRRAFETGIAEVDFLGTAEDWKLAWTRTTRPHDWLFLFGNTFRGRLVHQLKFRLKPALQRLQSGSRQPADGR